MLNGDSQKFEIEVVRHAETEYLRELISITVNGVVCCYEVPIERARQSLLEWLDLNDE